MACLRKSHGFANARCPFSRDVAGMFLITRRCLFVAPFPKRPGCSNFVSGCSIGALSL
jgi:hypothetical protein